MLHDRFSGTAARQEFFELFHEQRAKTPEAVLRGRKERDRARRPPSGRTHGGTARPTSRQGSARTMYLKRCQEPLELVSIAVRDVTTPGRSFEVAVSQQEPLLRIDLRSSDNLGYNLAVRWTRTRWWRT